MFTGLVYRFPIGVITLFVAASAAGQAKPEATTGVRIDIVITEIQPRGGELIVALYDSADAWLKLDSARAVQKVRIDGATGSVAFEGVNPGDYGVVVIHDENRNGKIDFSWFPLPTPREGSGISNNPRTFVGPPSFKQARFSVGRSDQTIAIAMLY